MILPLVNAIYSKVMARVGLNNLVATMVFAAIAAMPLGAEIRLIGVASAAGLVPGFPAGGSLASIFCTGLTGIEGIVLGSGTPLPSLLLGVRVRFEVLVDFDPNGWVDAPILAVADLGKYQQVNIQMPWIFSASRPVVLSQGVDSRTVIPLGATAPWGQFFTDYEGFAIAQHAEDFSPVTQAKPARPGEWIIVYGTNFGPVSNPPYQGILTPSSAPFAEIVDDTSVWLYRVPKPDRVYSLQANFRGLAPGLLGVYQFNVKVPDDLARDDIAIVARHRWDCGFFFTQGCGRGIVQRPGTSAKVHTEK